MQRTVGAGQTTVGFGGSGTPVVNGTNATLQLDGALPKATATGNLVNPAGNPVPVSATGRVAAAEVAGAFGRLAGGLVKAGAVIGAGIAIWEFAKEMGYLLRKGSNGELIVEKQTQGAGSVENLTAEVQGYVASFSQSVANCRAGAGGNQQQADYYCPKDPGFRIEGRSVDGKAQNRWVFYFTQAPSQGGGLHEDFGPWVDENNTVEPATLQQLQDAIAAKSGWPTTSNVKRMLEDSVAVSGQKLQTGPLEVTGPATSPGKTSQTNGPAGSVTNNTTTYNHTYQGNTVTTTTVNNSSNYNPVTNTTTTTTTTETPDKEPTDDCEANPDRAGCADLDTPEGAIPRTSQTITFSPENVFGNGSCPADRYQTIGGRNIKVIDWTANCSKIAAYGRPVLILLATYAAFIMLIPGKNQ